MIEIGGFKQDICICICDGAFKGGNFLWNKNIRTRFIIIFRLIITSFCVQSKAELLSD